MSLISVVQAREKIIRAARCGAIETKSIEACYGMAVAQPVSARITQPPFDSSAMDGYAVKFHDALKAGTRFAVIGEAPAGKPFESLVGSGEAVRIFTGSAMPTGTNHVVLQENVRPENGSIILEFDEAEARHVRPAGKDFSVGDVLVREGRVVNAATQSMLRAANIQNVDVIAKPKVSVITPGNELVEVGSKIEAGQIVESNSVALATYITDWGGEPVFNTRTPDDLGMITDSLTNALESSDIVLIVGGASVGDYDFAKQAFANVGGELIFNKVAVRPGKPVWYGRVGEKSVLGLPGNPASALTCALLFLCPLILQSSGRNAFPELKTVRMTSTRAISSNGPREHFIRARCWIDEYENWRVDPILSYDSSLLSVFSKSNCFVRMLQNQQAVSEGEQVSVLMQDTEIRHALL